MNYEEKYKEALERAKKLYGEGTPTTDGCMISPNPKSISVAEVQGEQNDKEVRKELNSLYRRIDICISELIGARRTKDIEAEGKALSTMEGLMSQTLQFLDYLADFLDNNHND